MRNSPLGHIVQLLNPVDEITYWTQTVFSVFGKHVPVKEVRVKNQGIVQKFGTTVVNPLLNDFLLFKNFPLCFFWDVTAHTAIIHLNRKVRLLPVPKSSCVTKPN